MVRDDSNYYNGLQANAQCAFALRRDLQAQQANGIIKEQDRH
jgi:hypothetical protein